MSISRVLQPMICTTFAFISLRASGTILLCLASSLPPGVSGAQNLRQSGELTRSNALAVLKGCATRPVTRGCSEDTADYLIRLYNRGDNRLLKPLLDAGPRSDGALAEMLGDFYAKVLWKHPRVFLESLSSRPRKEQKELAWMAGATDGGGMPADMLREVRHALTRFSSRRSRLSSIARLCLKEVNRANATAPNRR